MGIKYGRGSGGARISLSRGSVLSREYFPSSLILLKSQVKSGRSSNRPSFAAANQLVTLTRVTNERVEHDWG